MAEDAKIDQNFKGVILGTSNVDSTPKRILADDITGRLLVDIIGVITPADSIVDGIKTVTTAGTAEKLTASETIIQEVTIQALPSNTGKIAIGGATVDASTGRGTVLGKYSSITLKIDDLSKIYVDSRVNGEGVSYVYLA